MAANIWRETAGGDAGGGKRGGGERHKAMWRAGKLA